MTGCEPSTQPKLNPALKDLRKLKYRSVCLGSYIPWDVKANSKLIADELGWQGDQVENVPPGYGYEKIECYLQGVRDYIKYIKRGYTRPSHLATLDVRNNRITREEAMEIINKYEGYKPPSLELFLKHIGLTEEEFYEVALSHGVSPYKHDPESDKPGKKTADFETWSPAGEMPREYAEEQMKLWRARHTQD